MNNRDTKVRGRSPIHNREVNPSAILSNDDIDDENEEIDPMQDNAMDGMEEDDEEELKVMTNQNKKPNRIPQSGRLRTNLYSQLRQDLREVNKSDDTYSKYKPRIQTKQPKKGDKNTSKTGYDWSKCPTLIFWLIFTVLASVASFHVFDGKRFFQNKTTNGSVIVNKEWPTFETEFQSFERIYSEVIPIKGFKILKTAVKKVMTRNEWPRGLNKSPAIILLISSEDNQKTLRCVERDFVKSINMAYSENSLNVINGIQTDASDIVDKFDLSFRDEKRHTIIIENIESIAPKDVMSLHQFTDHENAKYKDVIIVMTAINYQKFNLSKTVNPLEMDKIASQLFEVKWKNDLSGEQRFALISRLTTSVVTIIGPMESSFQC